MAQHTVFVEFFYPSDVKTILSCDTDDKIKKACFVVTKYDTEEKAVDAYERTQAPWSIILDDDEDVNKFVDEAYEHLKSNSHDDWRWLINHFI